MVAPTKRSLNKHEATSVQKQASETFDQEQRVLAGHVSSAQVGADLQRVATSDCARQRVGRQVAATSGDHLESIQIDRANGQQERENQQQEYKVSELRWFILAGICTLGLCNGFVNTSDAILNVLVAIVDIPLERYIYISQFLALIPILISIPAAWLNDKFGTRVAIYTCLCLTCFKYCFRALMFAPHVAHWRQLAFYYWSLQSILYNFEMTLYYCLPLKVSESWFPEKERSIAWSLIVVLPALGNAAGALVYPRYLDPNNLIETIPPQAYVYLCSSFVALTAVCLTVTRSSPREGSPSERSQNSLVAARKVTHTNDNPSGPIGSAPMDQTQQRRRGIRRQMLRMLKNKDLVILLVTQTVINALPAAVSTMLQDILASAHLSQVFTGNFIAATCIFTALFQIFGSFRMKPAPNLSKLNEENTATTNVDVFKTRVCKVFVIAQGLLFLIYLSTLVLQQFASLLDNDSLKQWLEQNQWILVVGANLIYVSINCVAVPNFTDQTGQLISGQVSEATICAVQTALFGLCQMLSSVVFVSLREKSEATGKANYTRSVIFAMAMTITCTCVYVLFFDPEKRYKKKGADDEQQLDVEEDEEDF